MITLTDLSWQALSWQEQLRLAISDIDDLSQALNLPKHMHYSNFPILVPLPYLARIEKGNPRDPLLLQVLSQIEETHRALGFHDQPLVEAQFMPIKGLLKKYQQRALIITTGVCAINCRYCFRRNFPYRETQPNRQDWLMIFAYLAQNKNINEVILSGGDPLMLSDQRLSWITQQLNTIDHLKTLRIHSRLPLVIPQRINAELIDWVSRTKLKLVLVNHINHPNEIDEEVGQAMAKLMAHQVTLLNQSVLLKNINDHSHILTALSEQLFRVGILPYYLHLLDPVTGTTHFEVTETQAVKLMRELRSQLPGYLVPRLAREVPGAASKQVLA